jgi:hypothetical protein
VADDGYRTALLSATRRQLLLRRRTSRDPIASTSWRSRSPLITVLLQGAKESVREQHHGGDCCSRSLFIAVATHLHPRTTIRRRTDSGHLPGAAIVFFAYIGFDAISTAAEETKNPQRIAHRHPRRTGTRIDLRSRRVRPDGMVPHKELAVADPLAHALQLAGSSSRLIVRLARRSRCRPAALFRTASRGSSTDGARPAAWAAKSRRERGSSSRRS